MDHVAGIVNYGEMFVADGIQPLLPVGLLGKAAVPSFDDENRAFDAAKKFNGLS